MSEKSYDRLQEMLEMKKLYQTDELAKQDHSVE